MASGFGVCCFLAARVMVRGTPRIGRIGVLSVNNPLRKAGDTQSSWITLTQLRNALVPVFDGNPPAVIVLDRGSKTGARRGHSPRARGLPLQEPASVVPILWSSKETSEAAAVFCTSQDCFVAWRRASRTRWRGVDYADVWLGPVPGPQAAR